MTSIGEYAFADCASLSEIEIPATVTSIGIGAFYSCDKLENITIKYSRCTIGAEDEYEHCTISGGVIIHGYLNSTAQEYAEKWNMEFVSLSRCDSLIWDGAIASGFASGSGSEDDPYIIETAAQLAYYSYSAEKGKDYSCKYIKLTSDIYLNETTDFDNWGITAPQNIWTPIFIDSWDPNYFDGNGHSIVGLYCVKNSTDKNYYGLS